MQKRNQRKPPFSRKRDDEPLRHGKSKRPRIKKPRALRGTERPFDKSKGVRINKFIANAGFCSRREADKYIAAGVVKINGKVVTELGTRVMPGDEVLFDGQRVSPERLVYLLLNKPKDYITTVSDPQGRRTVMDLVKNACDKRIFPVGRLDRNTTGLLLLTNDGELTTRLTHPKYGVSKLYHVKTDKPVAVNDLVKLNKGVELEDGIVKADKASYVDNSKKDEVGVLLHSGKNRVIRRMFEKLGYRVVKLDRVAFGNLTKKNLPRGKFRFLTPIEVNQLKMLALKE